MTIQPAKASHPRKALWIPATFVAAMSLVVVVNGIMVYFATSTFPGLDTTKAYVHGLAYNETLQGSAASKALGWQAMASIADGRLRVSVQDRHGLPVSGLTIHGEIVRRTTTAFDQRIQLTADPVQAGQYVTGLDLPAAGLWELRLVARNAADGTIWQWNDRIVAP